MNIFAKVSFAAFAAAFIFVFIVPNNAQAQPTGQVNYGNLIAALNNIDKNIQDVRELSDLTRQDIHVANVNDLLSDKESGVINKVDRALQLALDRNDVKVLIKWLQSNARNMQLINEALRSADVNVSDAIAMDVLGGGGVVVYYKPGRK